MAKPHVVCRPDPTVTPERAQALRAEVWRYVFSRRRKGSLAGSDLYDPKRPKNGPSTKEGR